MGLSRADMGQDLLEDNVHTAVELLHVSHGLWPWLSSELAGSQLLIMCQAVMHLIAMQASNISWMHFFRDEKNSAFCQAGRNMTASSVWVIKA